VRIKLLGTGFGLVTLVAVAALALHVGGERGHRLSVESALADAPADLSYGFVDQSTGAQLLAQWDPLFSGGGTFKVGVPGVGVLRGTAPATVTTNPDGSRHLAFTGAGTRDAGAQLVRPLGYAFTASGTLTATSFTVSADAAPDLVSATWMVTIDSTPYSSSAPAPAHNAGDVIQAELQALHDKDWATAYSLFSAGFQAGYPQLEFAGDMASGFPAGTSLTSWTVLPSVAYQGEPGPGLHTATALVSARFSDGSVTAAIVSQMELVLDAGNWRLTDMGKPATPTVVSPANMNGWGFLQETATATGSLVAGPGTPPSGGGSAKIALGSTGGGLYGTLGFAGTRLDAIDAINYSTYQPTGNPGTVQTISLQFDMDYDLTDSNTAWQGRLVFEPYFTNTVTKGSWQTWDPLAGKWWATGNPGKTKCPQSAPCTWSKVLQEFPNAGLRVSVGGLEFKAGSGWPANWQGNVDAFVIVVGDEAKAFDFEP
jgi:hypothetical protein